MSAKSLFDIVFSPISFILGDKVGHAISGVVLAGIGIATGQLWLVGIGLSMVSGSGLLGGAPKAPKTNPADRLYAHLDTTAARKFWLGNTAGATDVRYQTYTGSKQEFYHQIIASASHAVQSIDEIWFDNEKAWTASGGVQGRFVNFLTVTAREVGTSANGIAIDSTWTTSCTLTGCAYIYLKFSLLGPDDSTPSPFQGGVSNRLTIRGKGAKVYDPRLDSTVPGGSGTQRANDQTTWAWDDNASRNPALQELWYELGWKINGKLAVGKGLPPARLDLPSYITAANLCDESVALKAGGTEPRYRSDGVLSEGDDPSAVRETLCATMNATMRDAGGKISLAVLYNDLASTVTPSGRSAFDESDIIEDGEWNQTPPLTQAVNIVRGQRVDPSDVALYQLTDYPEQSITSPDGIDRILPVDFMLVQSDTQAQRLAKLKLLRNQYQGRYGEFTGGPAWWGVSIGNVVPMSHPGLSWSGKLFRAVGQQIAQTGQTRMTLLEENAAIYAWTAATDEKTGITGGTVTVADPTNNPLLPPTSNLTTLILNSRAVGATITVHADGTVDVTNHDRVYSDKTVSVTGASGTASSGTSGQIVGLYYDQQSRAGGTVTYAAVAGTGGVPSSAFASSAHPYRHFVGYGTIPATGTSGGTGSTGGGGYGGGSGGIQP